MIPARPKAPPCADTPDLFTDEHPGAIARAKAICQGCPVTGPCLEYALKYQVEGVWAATTSRQRHEMRKRAGIVAAPIVTTQQRRQGTVA